MDAVEHGNAKDRSMKSRSVSGKASFREPWAFPDAVRPDRINLCPVTVLERAAIKKLVLDPGQEQFAGSVDAVFDGLEASQYPDQEHAFTIVVAKKTVGFFILREKQAPPGWAPRGAVTLHSFRISSPCQGKGYGRVGVGLAISWLRRNRPEVKELMLAVNARNVPAKSLYLKAGFVDTGSIFRGSIGDQHILTFHLLQSEG
ncbi:GNAT family N-acetyltransferase [Mesorhizobium sp. CO1-1-3]